MITAVFAFTGAMLGSMFINFVLHEPNHRIENDIYRHGTKDKTDSSTSAD